MRPGAPQFDELGGGFAGRLPACLGVVAFGDTPTECPRELRSMLEDRLLVGLRLGGGEAVHQAPQGSAGAPDAHSFGRDLNGGAAKAPLDALQAQRFPPSFAPAGIRRAVLRRSPQFMVCPSRRLAVPQNAEFSVPRCVSVLRGVEAILRRPGGPARSRRGRPIGNRGTGQPALPVSSSATLDKRCLLRQSPAPLESVGTGEPCQR